MWNDENEYNTFNRTIVELKSTYKVEYEAALEAF